MRGGARVVIEPHRHEGILWFFLKSYCSRSYSVQIFLLWTFMPNINVYIIFKIAGVFIARGKEDALVTRNMVSGESVYGEKKISVDGEGGDKIEYRVWNPFRSKLAAAILGGIDKIHMKPGSKVLYLGAASGTTVSHVSDIVGPVSETWFCFAFSKSILWNDCYLN